MPNIFNLTPGPDTFAGLPGDYNIFRFTPATLQGTDTITGVIGGAFYDVMEQVVGGTTTASQFAGVSNIEALQVSGGAHVTLSDSLVAGSSLGYFTIFGNTADNDVDGTGVSAGHTLYFVGGGGGGDRYVGGAGDDVFSFTAAELNEDIVLGGNGQDTLDISTPGTLSPNAFFIVKGMTFLELRGNTLSLDPNMTNAAQLRIDALTGGNVVDGSAVFFTTYFVASAGSQTFTGGGGKDNFVVAPGDLTAADVFNGNAGLDQLILLHGAGSTVTPAQLAGITNIEQIVMEGGSIQVASGLSSAGTLAIGTSGDGTLDATDVTDVSMIFLLENHSNTVLGSPRDDQFRFASGDDLTAVDTLVGGGSDHYDTLVVGAGHVSAADLANVSGIDIAYLNGAVNFFAPQGITSHPIFSFFSNGTDNTGDATAFTTTQAWYYAFPGAADTFRGGAATDTFFVAAADLDATDTFDGNGGVDQLTITTLGSITAAALAGVSDVEILQLTQGGTVHLPNGLSTTSLQVVASARTTTDTLDGAAVTAYRLILEGEGGPDVLIGGAQDDFVLVPDDLFMSIDGNAGLDRVNPATAGQSLDLTGTTNIADIEIFDLRMASAATLTLTGDDIPQITGGGDNLYVVGDADDTLNAGTGYALVATNVINNTVAAGHTFTQYHHTASNTELFVDNAVGGPL